MKKNKAMLVLIKVNKVAKIIIIMILLIKEKVEPPNLLIN